MLKGKTVVLGVTGSIAAYKIANLASKEGMQCSRNNDKKCNKFYKSYYI